MSLNVIHELLVAKFSESLKINSRAKGLPLEVEQVRRICLLPARIVFGFVFRRIIRSYRASSLFSFITCGVCSGGIHSHFG